MHCKSRLCIPFSRFELLVIVFHSRSLECIDKKCDHKRFAGDGCTSDNQCYSGVCNGGYCLGRRFLTCFSNCKGIAEGLPCLDTEAWCDVGLFCNKSGLCQKQLLAVYFNMQYMSNGRVKHVMELLEHNK